MMFKKKSNVVINDTVFTSKSVSGKLEEQVNTLRRRRRGVKDGGKQEGLQSKEGD